MAIRLLHANPKNIIGSFLQLQLTFNSGAAFNIATQAAPLFSLLSLLAIAGIFIFTKSLTSLPWAMALGLLLGGILGNLSDRLCRSPYFLRGAVVDWIRLPHWPVFNVADTSIVISAAAIALLVLRNVKPRSRDDE
jgi:signal peptidase II